MGGWSGLANNRSSWQPPNRRSPTVRKRTRLSLALTALMLTLCSTGCLQSRSPDCSWVKPIHLEPDTAEWLKEHQPWPPGLLLDLNEIDKHNMKVREIIGSS